MLNTIKSFKWFFTVAAISVLLGIFTFLAFLNEGLFFLSEQDLQYLLILDSAILIIFLVFLGKEVFKIFFQYKKKRTGSKTSLNYVLQFSLFAFIPSLLIAVFSLLLFNAGLQQYFDRKISSAVKNSYEVAKNYVEERKKSVEADILLMSQDLNRYSETLYSNTNRFKQIVRSQRLLRRLDEIYLIDSSGSVILADTNNIDEKFLVPSEDEFDLALEGKPVQIIGSATNKASAIIKLNNFIDTYLYVSRDVQPKLLQYLKETEQGVTFYYTVKDKRTGVRITFAIIYIIIVSMFLFLTVVLAITFAGRLTRPIVNLISASKEISSGKLDTKVPNIETDEEIETLNKNFNNMIDRLKTQQDKLLTAERFSAWETVARKLAHEIKNPLTPIQLSIDRLRDKYSEKLKDDKKEFGKYLETINRQITDIKNLVNEFSDFARMPSPILKKINLINVINRSVEFYKMSLRDIRIVLTNNVKINTYIMGDDEQLYRVFINLIKNSIEAIGEKKQKNGNLQGKINVEIAQNNEYIVIKMQDNGIGFSEIKNIVKPYYTTKKLGTGLGLPIVTKIINEHNGDIRFIKHSEGAKINIFLPIYK